MATAGAGLAEVATSLRSLRDEALASEAAAADAIAQIDPVHRDGARNLVHYLALRAHDLRELQEKLTASGLSSLGRMERDVLGNLDAVLRLVDAATTGRTTTHLAVVSTEPDALRRHAARLLGGAPEDRSTRIMVTLPTEAADDPEPARRFVAAGMDLARINCAHDDPAAWQSMAAHVRAAGDGIPVAMDLAGPKLRTGPITPGPRVVKVKPTRDAAGAVLDPARLQLVGAVGEVEDDAPAVPVTDAAWVAALREGEAVRFVDARGRRRRMRVVRVSGATALIEGDRTVYMPAGAELRGARGSARVGDIPPLPGSLRVRPGDTLRLTRSLEPGGTAGDGVHRVGCTLPEALDALRPGARVAFDDGKIEGLVEHADAEEAHVRIVSAKPGGTRLREEKGINLPDSDVAVSALTDDDLRDLDAVVAIADIVQLSFVRSAEDVRTLFDELDARGGHDVGVVVKIETVRGFRALPAILLELMRRPDVGVMIARGDLAVEAGFERLAEVQEEILWICEAAHVPVIWATQVLDELASGGVPTRAEVTDAAAGERAECVMLNKGPHIDEAIRALDDILRRMQGHLDKKRPLLRRLRSWSPEA